MDGDHAFSRIRDVALSQTGKYLVVLDGAEPLVHVFDRETGTSRAFGRRGGGPGEFRSPYGLALSGDSLLVVNGLHRVDLFTFDGQLVDHIGENDLGLRLRAVTDGCSGSWFVYGLVPDPPRDTDVVWLHRTADLSASPVLESVIAIPGTPKGYGYGALEGLDGSDDAVLLWHRMNGAQAGWVFECDNGSTHLVSTREDPVEVRRGFTDAGLRGVSLTLPDTLFHGAALHGFTAFVSHKWDNMEGEPTTGLRYWAPDGTGCATLPGSWFVRDAADGGVVLSTSDPFPRVLLVPEAVLSGPETLGRPCG